MKTNTATNKRSLPNPFRFTAYILAVAAICFLNWTVLKAGDPVEYHSAAFQAKLTECFDEALEPQLIVENWMLGYDELTLAAREEVEIEEWMLGYDEVTLAAREEVEVEEWMLGFDELSLAENEEIRLVNWMLGYDDVTIADNIEIQTENWMYDYNAFTQAHPSDHPQILEEWMVDLTSWTSAMFLAGR